MCPDSGVHNDLWLLWREQTGGAREGGSRGTRAEAIAVVQVDNDGGLGFLPQESLGPGTTDQASPSPITPIFPLRKPRPKTDPQVIPSTMTEAQVS